MSSKTRSQGELCHRKQSCQQTAVRAPEPEKRPPRSSHVAAQFVDWREDPWNRKPNHSRRDMLLHEKGPLRLRTECLCLGLMMFLLFSASTCLGQGQQSSDAAAGVAPQGVTSGENAT